MQRIERYRVLRVAGVVGPVQRDHSRLHETGQVVDMAIGLVVDHALAQPDDLPHAEVITQMLLDVRTAHVRISVAVQQALLGDQRRALAIHVDGAAFIDERRAISVTGFDLQHLASHGVVQVPREIQPAVEPAPGIEAPVHTAFHAFLVDHERGADVAHPGVVVGNLDHAPGFGQQAARELEVLRGHAHAHGLEPRDGGSHFRENPLRRLGAVTPVVGPFGPQHPATGVRLELGRHGESVGGRRALQCSGHEGRNCSLCTGPDIWNASVRVMDAAVQKAYGGKKKIHWLEVYAGEKSFNLFKNWLPDETVEACREYLVSIKGPLTTPVGGGIRSLNVALRQLLDLYVCLRPVRWFKGVPSPVKAPRKSTWSSSARTRKTSMPASSSSTAPRTTRSSRNCSSRRSRRPTPRSAFPRLRASASSPCRRKARSACSRPRWNTRWRTCAAASPSCTRATSRSSPKAHSATGPMPWPRAAASRTSSTPGMNGAAPRPPRVRRRRTRNRPRRSRAAGSS